LAQGVDEAKRQESRFAERSLRFGAFAIESQAIEIIAKRIASPDVCLSNRHFGSRSQALPRTRAKQRRRRRKKLYFPITEIFEKYFRFVKTLFSRRQLRGGRSCFANGLRRSLELWA
jgi:hypothetical protein